MLASMVLYALLGTLAGALTTVAGLGGGMVLLLALAALDSPHRALAVTAPALLLGNLHRLWRGRHALDRATALPLVLGALPGSLLGGLLASLLPAQAVGALMLAMTGLTVARRVGLSFTMPTRAGLPVGLLTGAISATSGGAAMLLAPFLRARGLTGQRYVCTTAAVAVALHVGRVIAYGATGMSDASTLRAGLLLALAIAAGNLLGDRLARGLGDDAQTWIQDGVMVVCTGLALAGVAG